MKVKLNDIKPHPLNKEIYLVEDIDDLKDSIKELGLLEKIVINQDNFIISGNRRYEALKSLGFDELDVEIKNINDEKIGFYIINYNKQRIKKASELLHEIKYLYDYYGVHQGKRTDLTSNNNGRSITTQSKISELLKISNGNISKLLFIDRIKPDLIDVIDKGIMTINQAHLECQRFEKSNQQNINDIEKDNQIIDNERFKIYNKSSISMTEVEDDVIQTIFTSFPYWKKRNYNNGVVELGQERTPDLYIENLLNHFKECYRVLKKTGSMFLVMGDTYLNGSLQNIPHRLIIELVKEGWILRNTIIWKKTNPKPSSSHRNLGSTYEFIFHLVKDLKYLYNEIKLPQSSSTKPSLPPRHRNLTNEIKEKVSPYYPKIDGKNMGDFWDNDVVKTAVYNQKVSVGLEHPAPFPLEIVYLPILQTTGENDWVLDPFMGSGNCGIAALKLKRKFIGYDINKGFCDLAASRLSKIY